MTEYDNIEQQLTEEGQIFTVLHGVSMWPMIRNSKDPVLLRPLHNLRPTTARPLDVVAYHKEDRYVVHRVLQVMPDHYIIRGDNCLDLEYVPHDRVFAILTHWWHNGREYSIDDRSYRCYVALWLFFHPLYRCVRRIKRLLRS